MNYRHLYLDSDCYINIWGLNPVSLDCVCVFGQDTRTKSKHCSSEPIMCQISPAWTECMLSETPLCCGPAMMDDLLLAVHFLHGRRALTTACRLRSTAL